VEFGNPAEQSSQQHPRGRLPKLGFDINTKFPASRRVQLHESKSNFGWE
jgi:hypothetical protein